VKQLLVETSLSQEESVTLTGKEYHYLCRVRRVKVGEVIELKDSSEKRYNCRIVEIKEDSCLIEVGELIQSHIRPYDIHLYLCLCKGKKTDLMIRQATETGVRSITLLDSDFSQVKLKEESREDHKYERWRKIIKEAQQQSGSSINTTLNPLIEFKDLPEIQSDHTIGFFCHQEKLGPSQLADLGKGYNDIHMIIGSEGGLSSGEIEIMKKKGYSSLFLGDNVLRAETASLFALAAIMTTMEIT
jgi:16S rRNA (uracil1498-N3)-methyltransferase